jgi:predicted ester cyclase
MQATGNATAIETHQQTEQTRSIMTAYLDALVARGDYGRHFADTVTFTMMDTGEITRGREPVVGLIDYLHTQAFDATVVVKRLVVDGSQAVLEAEFTGTHTGEFAGIAPTERPVKLPYAVGYDIDGYAITALRIYLPMDALIRQIREG